MGTEYRMRSMPLIKPMDAVSTPKRNLRPVRSNTDGPWRGCGPVAEALDDVQLNDRDFSRRLVSTVATTKVPGIPTDGEAI